MFSIFKSKRQKMEDQRKKLLQLAYEFSTIDRKKSDEFYAQAEQISEQLIS